MTIARIGLIFEDRPRPETTGGYCIRALNELVPTIHRRPDELDGTAMREADWWIRIDDGLDYDVPAHVRPLAYWAIDTHVDLPRILRAAAACDAVFAAQKPGAEALAASGIGPARWLPLACDPGVHRPFPESKRYDFAFVGHINGPERAELLELLQRRYPRHFVGQAYFDDLARAYSSARIAFNRSLADDVNMRVFEGMACGGLLVTNRLSPGSGLDELFDDSRELATYGTLDELFEKCDYYLNRPRAREAVAKAGRARVLDAHTYRHRMADMLRRLPTALTRSTRALAQTAEMATVGAGSPMLPETPVMPPAPPPGYFDHARPEILAEVPRTAKSILDVGCGHGRLGAALKSRQGARVVGWEIDPAAAARAREVLDEVVAGDIETAECRIAPGTFDAVVCGDVLEHLRDPAAVLRTLRNWLAADGLLVASLPNAQHHSVVRGLLRGDWTYEPAGILDATHLRFFTRREAEKLFEEAGYEIVAVKPLPGAEHAEWTAAGERGSIAVGGLQIDGLGPDAARAFYTYQWLFTAQPADRPDFGLTSIIVLAHNALSLTRACLESVRFRTPEPIELVCIDNGSTDGTWEYLQSLSRVDPRVRIVRNSSNRGYPAGVNQGLQLARGRQVLLLNNDTVVTSGWLRRLLAALYASPRVGLVGPCSNRVSGPQQIPVDYDGDLVGLDGFAWELGRTRRSHWQHVERLVGFCLLVRSEVLDRIGGMDERFGIGNYDDDDFCRRARAAGYELRIAEDAFVYHVGSASFRAAGIDLKRLLRENRTLYEEKWAKVTPRPGLSGCLIVRDNAATLAACLDSLRPWVDEIVVVDTGSKDDTPDIARRCGARVFEFAWCDDFSAARNESLRHAECEWIFWMDSDDTLDDANGRGLRDLAVADHPPGILGYVVRVHCPGPGPLGHLDTTVVDHVKLVRNRPELRFEGRIHEQLLPAIRRAGGEVAWTDLFVVHSGYDHSPAGQIQKRERDLKLLGLEQAERPDHPFTLFNLGMTHADIGEFDRAAEFLERSLRASNGESHVRKAHALLAHARLRLGDGDGALAACRAGLAAYPDDLELTFREALLHHAAGRLRDAADAYGRLLARPGERHFTSVDRGLAGYKSRQNLAGVFEELGDWSKALAEWQRVVAEVPDYAPGWRGLGRALLRAGLLDEATRAVETLDSSPEIRLRAEGRLLAGRLSEATDAAAALAAFTDAAEASPGDPEPWRELGRLAFREERWGDAQTALRAAVDRDDSDAASWHNLGLVLWETGQFQEARDCWRRSLRHRPGWEATQSLLDRIPRQS